MPKYAIVNPELLNLRAAPTTTAPVLRELKRGTVLDFLGDAGFDWLNVRTDGVTGYVSKLYVTLSDTKPADTTTPTDSKPSGSTTTKPGTGAAPGTKATVISTNGVNMRAGAGVQFPVITVLTFNAVVTVIATEGDWMRVRAGTQEGYVAKQFLNISSKLPTSGYLIERADLLETPLVPNRLIPAQTPRTPEAVVARTWNSYGGLVGKLSALLNIPVDTVVAVLVAESGGNAFGADNRMIIRFENHIFWRYWGQQNADLFNRHFDFDRSSPANSFKGHRWRPNLDFEWQFFHGSQDKEWQVLSFARTLDDTAALLSISMGAPQIMGFNFRRLGYESVQKMFEYFARSAHAQLIAMFDFVNSPTGVSQAIQALQNHDYLTFAGIYNGSANAQIYSDRIRNYAEIFGRLIPTAEKQPAPPPPTPVAPAPVTSMVVSTPLPPVNATAVVVSTMDGLSVRTAPNTRASVVTTLAKNQPIAALDSADEVQSKVIQPHDKRQYIKVRTERGAVGYVAAWLVAPSSGLLPATIDTYMQGIPDRYEIPTGYEALWAAQARLGLPDPFSHLPIRITTPTRLVNLTINGFGPNTAAAVNWRAEYKNVNGMHNGYDFIVETGTPVLAVADGILVRNWPFMSDPADRAVVLWCFLPERFKDARGNRMMSNVLVGYAHLSDNNIRQDLDVVSAGDVIGVSGTPARRKDNDHLHIEAHLLAGDTRLPPATQGRLTHYSGPQPNGNVTPFNPLLFFARPVARYLLHQGWTLGFGGRPAYPTLDMLSQMGAAHLGSLDQFTVAYYRYSDAVVWERRSARFPDGVVTTRDLTARLADFTAFAPFPMPTQKG